MVSIGQLADMIIAISGKRIGKRYISGPLGVRGRNSDNRLIRSKLDWAPSQPLIRGLETTYAWVEQQIFGKQPIAEPEFATLQPSPSFERALEAVPALAS